MDDFNLTFPSVKYDPLMKPEPIRWLVDGLWQLGKINGVAAFEKAGKSRLINYVLAGLPTGNVLGLPTVGEQRILYLCGEEPMAHVSTRLHKYASLQGISDHQYDIDFIEAAGMRLDSRDQRKALTDRILSDDRNMLIIDPWRRVHNADENDSNAMSYLYNWMRSISNVHGITIILVHHTPKISEDTDLSRIASWFRGSTDLAAILDTAQYVNRISKSKVEVRRQGRFPSLAPLAITDLGGASLNDDLGFERR